VLYVLMTICGERYGVEGSAIVEIIPAVELMSTERATQPFLCGYFNYHGERVPVVDSGLLMSGRPSIKSLSTRIAIIMIPGDDDRPCVLGLMAEEMTETEKCKLERFEGDSEGYEEYSHSVEILSGSSEKRGFRILNTRYLFSKVFAN